MDRRANQAPSRDREPDAPRGHDGSGRPRRLAALARGAAALLGFGALALGYSASQAGWRAKPGDAPVVGQVRRQDEAIRAVAYAPSDGTLAMAHHDGMVVLADRRGGSRLVPPEGRAESAAAVLCLAFAADGWTLACGDRDGDVTVWDVSAEGRRVARLRHASPVLSVAFAADGRTLASGSKDGTVHLWNVATGRERCVLRGHHDEIRAVAFAPDGRTLASGSGDGTIRLWDVLTRAEIGRLVTPCGRISSLAFAPDGRTLASGGGFPPDGKGGELVLWGRRHRSRAAPPARPPRLRLLGRLLARRPDPGLGQRRSDDPALGRRHRHASRDPGRARRIR